MNDANGIASLELEPHSGLHYRRACQPRAPRARLVLLHGVGGNETNFAGLESDWPDGLEVLLLRAPLRMGPSGFAWFPVSFTAGGPVIDAAQAEASRARVLRFLDALPPLPTVVAGFSQGGIVSASVGLSAPHKVSGFGLLSGRILPEIEPHIAPPEALRTLGAFVAHGRHDDKLPAFWAQRADALLARLGVRRETRLYDMGHELVRAEIADFAQWLRQTLDLGSPRAGRA
ncbi:alpha/beta hydrolase [Cupriavidus basilensis]|uniref:alpha/beta hydrolase n=1 Tax=Cupriavidus basilensis TaxID=68895 RepID=UPI000750E3EC|nr:phospholipase [Cupriavidus basilensis]